MGFEPGHKKFGGREKGTPNKKTWEARAICERLGVDPLEILARFAAGDWAGLGYAAATKTMLDAEGNTVQVDRIDEQLRQKSAKDLAPYIYPQLKAIEHSGDAGALAVASLTALLASALDKPKEEPNVDQSIAGTGTEGDRAVSEPTE